MTKPTIRQKRKKKTLSRNKVAPIVAVVGRSGSGKTTLIENLLRVLVKSGYSVGTIKDAKGGFEFDVEGKDSDRHFRAGAQGVAIVSAKQRKVAFFGRSEAKPSIDKLRRSLFPHVDLIILEGFRKLAFPKIETTRGESLYCKADCNLLAVVGDGSRSVDGVPLFSHEEIPALVRLIERTLPLTAGKRT